MHTSSAQLHSDLKALGYPKAWPEAHVARNLVSLAKRNSELLGIPRAGQLHTEWLRAAGLPCDLIELIEGGRILEEIVKSYAVIAATNRRLDAWEAQNPEAALAVPWAESRAAWKAAGRPELDWWTALATTRGLR